MTQDVLNFNGRYTKVYMPESIKDLIRGAMLAPFWAQMGWDQIVKRFRRTVLGPFWLSVGLIATAAGLSFIFSAGAGDWRITFEYVFTGLMVWMLIGTVISEGTAAFVLSSGILQTQNVPLTFTIYLHMQRQLVNFGAQILPYVIVSMALNQLVVPNWSIILGLPLVLAIGFFFSLAVAIPATRFRDVGLLVGNVVQLLFFVSPVFWRPDKVNPLRARLAEYNPLTHMLAVVREPLLGQAPNADHWIWALCTLAVSASVALWLLQVYRKRIIFWL